jgi:hypothetical protein
MIDGRMGAGRDERDAPHRMSDKIQTRTVDEATLPGAADQTAMPKTRLLIATGAAAVEVGAVPPLVRFLIEGASERFVITPALPSKLQWLVSDTDRATHEADERLDAVLGQMDEIGASAEGSVADDTPLRAFEDAIKAFKPDHILIALRSADHDGWQERHLVDRVRQRFHVPMTVFEIDRTGHAPAPHLAE